jgi:hypothetical protein
VPGVLYEPQRIYPKGVHKQVKADGRVKEREVTDYAAAREQHHLLLRPPLRELKLRVAQLQVTQPAQKASLHLRKKGRPGRDSFNACVSKERIGEFEYGKMAEFMRGIDILVSSGVPVTLRNDDFKGWYNQFVVVATERHLTVQLLDSRGSQENFVSDFGGMNAAHSADRPAGEPQFFLAILYLSIR